MGDIDSYILPTWNPNMSIKNFPSAIMTSDPGSFARNTILERKPQIISQILTENNYPPATIAALKAFREEIASKPVQPLTESAVDVLQWNSELVRFAGKTWLEIPWYFAEAFFYRKLLEATGYFQHGERQGLDPFRNQKERQMKSDLSMLVQSWEQFTNMEPDARFKALIHSSLWGNRADLSNFTVVVKALSGAATVAERNLILIDHTDRIRAVLANGITRLDFICDNVGSDLFFDLILSDFLLREGWAKEIHLNLKSQPFFVSDAMPADANYAIDLLKEAPFPGLAELGRRLDHDRLTGRLVLATDPFWTSWFMFRHMPDSLQRELANAQLVMVKGDVNYRRLLDDCHWPHTTPMEEICDYFPAPFAVLRTLKAEIIVALQPGQAEAIEAEDKTWLINGRRGIIQLVFPSRRLI